MPGFENQEKPVAVSGAGESGLPRDESAKCSRRSHSHKVPTDRKHREAQGQGKLPVVVAMQRTDVTLLVDVRVTEKYNMYLREFFGETLC